MAKFTSYEKKFLDILSDIAREDKEKIKTYIKTCQEYGIDLQTNYKYQNYLYELSTMAMNSDHSIAFDQVYDTVMKQLKNISPFQLVVEDTLKLEDDNMVYKTSIFKENIKEEKELLDSIRFGTNVEDGVYECPNCHSKKTVSQSKQTSASDEEIKAKVFCFSCKKTWKMSQIKIAK